MTSRRALVAAACAGVCLLATAAVYALSADAPAPVQPLRVVAAYRHDPAAFTQGLVIRDGNLYESTGLLGQSTVRRVDLKTGQVLVSSPFPAETFGEGLTIIGEELFLLTWQNNIGYVLDRATFRLKRTFRYSGEGWGLTDNGTALILSDGSPALRFLNPATGEVLRRLTVRDHGQAVDKLNELEFIDGDIYANIWYSRRIARIDARTGLVKAWLDATPLFQQVRLGDPNEDVLNGIAYDAEAKKLYVTGKRWPKLFEVVPN